jgi:nicotinate-nucleotide adenylyltransferase
MNPLQATERIGVLGGTFNPVHLGHLILGHSAAEALDLKTVLLVPCAIPPHKNPAGVSADAHRVAMLRAAVEGDLVFEVSDIELRRGGTSYAVDTVVQLQQENPDAELFFVVGADALPELHLWKDVYRLLDACTLVPFTRPGVSDAALRPDRLQLDAPWPERLLANLTSGRGVDVSSSDIRHRVAEGMSIRYLVPAAVEMYIAEHRLYLC